MNKSFEVPADESNLGAEDLELINKFTQKALTADEVFTFSVILCDNEIDRDFERFTVPALKKLSELFVGKTAIRDHSMKSSDQSARTYKTEVITDETRKNSLGESYVYLKAWCYMPRLQKNEDIISEIRSGILKEVSVGCGVKKSVCSVCSKEEGECSHIKGQTYGGKLCYFELTEPYDAYEWSFVAVPAQKNAGVTKGFNGDPMLRQMERLREENEALKEFALAGKSYKLKKETELSNALAGFFPKADCDICRKMAKSLSLRELESILCDTLPNGISSPQLVPAVKAGEINSDFKI